MLRLGRLADESSDVPGIRESSGREMVSQARRRRSTQGRSRRFVSVSTEGSENPSLSDSAIIEDDYAVGSNEFPVQGDILTRIQTRNGFQLREPALNVPIPLR